MTRTTPERPIDIEALFPELAGYRRTSTRLHPRKGLPKPQDSSVAGPFLWPADEPWPVCTAVHEKGRGQRLTDVRLRRRVLDEAWRRDPRQGPSEADREILDGIEREAHVQEIRDTDPVPLLAAAQLFVRDIPDLTGPEGYDLLQVLWCPFEVHGPERTMDVVLKWRRSQDVTEILTDIPEPIVVGRAECVPNICVLDPEQIVEHEYVELLSDELREGIEAWEEEILDAAEENGTEYPAGEEYELSYQGDLSIPPGWKVGGFAAWPLTGPAAVDCACGSPMRPLLTVHDREWDNGSLSWVPLEDRGTIRTMGANTPTGVYVGRGLMRVFTCPADPTHPHRLGFQ
ncbi:hypothetical protein KQY30_16625 [Streptomyces sp. GMY02]|uniref:hypothetical protein n=1 Tax=Streptomyces sp. GMY02 TaxID=1333528 RepID=UPI001C2C52A3|nr:hypothetical protein [Streptomyces sp. GMY02]QXE35642.1 hypothetical protein KQY30_16625 [Streptomyces sp. GMY02]